MSNNIHKTHFPVTKEMPWREKEKQAILLFKEIILKISEGYIDNDEFIGELEMLLFEQNKDLVEWVMKYKGE